MKILTKKAENYLKKNKWHPIIELKYVNFFLENNKCNLNECMLAFAKASSNLANHSPISNYKVGAVVRGYSGNLYCGINSEFLGVSLNNTVHAEQSAVHHAYISGEIKITHLAVNESPCGFCRQFLNEMINNKDFKIILEDNEENNKVLVLNLQKDILPYSFGPENIGNKNGLFDLPLNNFYLSTENYIKNSYIQNALLYLNKSYAPYSLLSSAAALVFKDNSTIVGTYLENSAYNPTLKAINAAFNLAVLYGKNLQDISTIYFLEGKLGSKTKNSSTLPETQELVNSLNIKDLKFEIIDLTN